MTDGFHFSDDSQSNPTLTTSQTLLDHRYLPVHWGFPVFFGISQRTRPLKSISRTAPSPDSSFAIRRFPFLLIIALTMNGTFHLRITFPLPSIRKSSPPS